MSLKSEKRFCGRTDYVYMYGWTLRAASKPVDTVECWLSQSAQPSTASYQPCVSVTQHVT